MLQTERKTLYKFQIASTLLDVEIIADGSK